MSKILTSKWLVLATLAFMVGIRIVDPWPVESLRLRAFDIIMKTQEARISEELITVDIGEPSMVANGQWPWPRQDIAELIRRLRDAGAAGIVLTVFFPEADRLGGDDALAESLAGEVIISQTASTQTRVTSGRHVGSAQMGEDPRQWLARWPGLLRSIESLERAAGGVGMAVIVPEVDGMVRRMPMLVVIGNEVYPNLALETLRNLAGDRSYQVFTSDAGVEAVRIPKYGRITTDAHGRIWIPSNASIPTIEASSTDLSLVNGRVAMIGLTAEGLGNLTPTPRGLDYTHHIQARVLQALIDGTSIQRPAYSDLLEIMLILLMGGAMFWLVPRTSVMMTVPVLVISLLSAAATSVLAWKGYLLLIDMTWPIISLLMICGHGIYNNFARENQLKQQIKKQFEHYLAPAMVKKLQSNPSLLKLGGDTRDLTLLFCDIRGFTPISEQYKTDPQGLTSLINRFLTPMTTIIMENEGTIDKYMGDCIMAFWNAPLDVEQQQAKAVDSALKMLEHLTELNRELAIDGLLPINIGIGLNTGAVVVGNMGSDQRFDYSCLGDAVNLASRLEGQSKSYGVKIIIGESTANGLSDDFVKVELDLIAVKGKVDGVRIYTVLGHSDIDKPQNLAICYGQHAKFLAAYRGQRWDMAIVIANSLKTAWNSKMKDYYEMMIERCKELKSDPPGSGWDHVYRATSK